MGSWTRLLRVMERVRLVAWMVAPGRVFLANGNQDGDDTVATLMFKQMGDVRTEFPPPPDRLVSYTGFGQDLHQAEGSGGLSACSAEPVRAPRAPGAVWLRFTDPRVPAASTPPSNPGTI